VTLAVAGSSSWDDIAGGLMGKGQLAGPISICGRLMGELYE